MCIDQGNKQLILIGIKSYKCIIFLNEKYVIAESQILNVKQKHVYNVQK